MMPLSHGPQSRTFGLVFFAVLALPLLFAAALSSDAAPTSLSQESKNGNGEAARASEAEVATLVRGMNSFGGKFYHALTSGGDAEEGNVFVSPYSVHRALGLVYPGARGQTASEIREVLRIELETERYLAAAAKLEQELMQRHERTEHMPEEWEPSKLEIANAAWHEKSIPFRQDYLDRLNAHFDLPVRAADFMNRPDVERARINEWVAERTNDLIDELIPENVIDEFTAYVLANAVYFLAQWETQFQEDNTRDRTFTTLAGDEVEVPMMHGDIPARYAQADGYTVIELPYRLSNQAMTILFPDEGKLAELEKQFSEGKVYETLDSMNAGRVRLAMPRFSMSTAASLKGLLEGMGMETAFSPQADFTGMSHREDIEIDEVLHQGTLKLDESGTEAAAATAVVMRWRSAPPPPDLEVTLDRPFLLLIRDTRTDVVIFLGRLADPSE